MQPEVEVLRVVLDYKEIWRRHFPQLFRRAHWHIVRHLCSTGRQGTSFGELSGFVRQIFLLDDATVRERIGTLQKLDLCTIEGGPGISARSVISPTPLLLRHFDEHCIEFAGQVASALAMLETRPADPAITTISPRQRAIVLRLIDSYCEPWRDALDRVFGERNLSQARRMEARRNMIAPSHLDAALKTVQHHYETQGHGAPDGILADRIAAHLLDLTGQNFQTTRDHISYLIEIGLIERRGGRSLHVGLSPPAARAIGEALGETAARWRTLARQLHADGQEASDAGGSSRADWDDDQTINVRRATSAKTGLDGHRLRIVEPPAERRHITISSVPLTIGRVAPADLVLAGADISRAHCRIEFVDGRLCVTDLKSTNGTFVNGHEITGTVELARGAELRIGSFVLEYEHHLAAEPDDGEGTLSIARRSPAAAHRPARAVANKRGKSA